MDIDVFLEGFQVSFGSILWHLATFFKSAPPAPKVNFRLDDDAELLLAAPPAAPAADIGVGWAPGLEIAGSGFDDLASIGEGESEFSEGDGEGSRLEEGGGGEGGEEEKRKERDPIKLKITMKDSMVRLVEDARLIRSMGLMFTWGFTTTLEMNPDGSIALSSDIRRARVFIFFI